ncbi:hypothetical protein SacN8_08860 [Sulfolobus acidocaldarius N8]|uniref:Uncharacterized protein n=2 Tax=Sulfolobus acidocaldarius TaxID=2285 RepID=M1JEC0_9CREN|nr:hypothetical protein SacN8_08860 [Sulfolobus acidocaldarius N8]AGE74005.1 hypothetical protein SacRon12I_08870 [Sulfolobus acidocaldarius Ron12/I]
MDPLSTRADVNPFPINPRGFIPNIINYNILKIKESEEEIFILTTRKI